jgi:predicted PurR-regulated permease PerM
MIPNVKIRQVLFLLLISAIFGLIFWNLRFFIPALLGAYTLYVLLRKPIRYLVEIRHWKPKLATATAMLLSLFVLLLPVYALIGSANGKIASGFQNSQQIFESTQNAIIDIESRFNIHLLTPERITSLSAWAVQMASSMLNATLGSFVMLLVSYFILWFMLTEDKKMELSFFSWLPLKDSNIKFLKAELNDLVYSNAIGIPLMGVIQGLAGLIGYSLAGVENLWFWVLMTFIAGMIPFLGVMLAFVPLSLLLFSKGQSGQALFILVYGLVVIGSVDNLARMWLMKKIGHTHPLVTLFGVVIGLKLFGFVGFVFGPILIAMFILLVKTYHNEFRE